MQYMCCFFVILLIFVSILRGFSFGKFRLLFQELSIVYMYGLMMNEGQTSFSLASLLKVSKSHTLCWTQSPSRPNPTLTSWPTRSKYNKNKCKYHYNIFVSLVIFGKITLNPHLGKAPPFLQIWNDEQLRNKGEKKPLVEIVTIWGKREIKIGKKILNFFMFEGAIRPTWYNLPNKDIYDNLFEIATQRKNKNISKLLTQKKNPPLTLQRQPSNGRKLVIGW